MNSSFLHFRGCLLEIYVFRSDRTAREELYPSMGWNRWAVLYSLYFSLCWLLILNNSLCSAAHWDCVLHPGFLCIVPWGWYRNCCITLLGFLQ